MENIKKQKIVLLGSTGSIGRQTLAVCRRLQLEVTAMSCFGSVDLFWQQIQEFMPRKVAVADPEAADKLAVLLKENNLDHKVELLRGSEGVTALATLPCDRLVMAIIGFAAIEPMLAAIRAKQVIAMANKEVIVATGQFILDLVKESGAEIYPVDSEPSAIWQSIVGNINPIKKVILTASGGPFRHRENLEGITVQQALQHPVWSMGTKITIDSATMMNKGLEMIEISRLFNLNAEQIEVIVHPEGIIHSAVEFQDGAAIAQMGLPDMELPIQFALTYPERKAMPDKPPLKLAELANLSFFAPDLKKFKALALAYEAQKQGGYLPAILNAANEVAVDAFVQEKISFLNIAALVEQTMQKSVNQFKTVPKNIQDILQADLWARDFTKNLIEH